MFLRPTRRPPAPYTAWKRELAWKHAESIAYSGLNMPMIGLAGMAEVLLHGEAVASGSYELKLESQGSVIGGVPRVTAKGFIRFQPNQRLLWAARGRRVRVRFDRDVELDAEITLFVRAARYLAFACEDALSMLDREG